MTTEQIPVVDLRDARLPERRAAFIETLGKGLERFGFVAVTGHGVPEDVIEGAYAAARQVFGLSLEEKRAYETPEDGRQRGYTPFGVEHAKDTAIPDIKEFWHVGRDLPADHPLVVRGVIPPNQYPAEVARAQEVFGHFFRTLEGFALTLLDAIGAYLGQPESFFRDMVHDGNSVLRIINYPDMGHVPAGAVRAAAHEDINLITVLPAATRPGLELMTREGEWMPVYTPPNVMLCDTGDMMQLLTAGQLPATTHRVVNPEDSDGGRLSMPFFVHPHPDYVLTPMRPGYADPIRTDDFFKARLTDTGVG